MAVFLNNTAGFKIQTGGSTYVDLSDHVESITINRDFDELEVTAMGDTGHRFVNGLEASKISITFLYAKCSPKYDDFLGLHAGAEYQ